MKKYLFVDDDVSFLAVLRLFFGSSPHAYISDVRQVSAVLSHDGPFDLMVTDYDMPYYNGVELAKWVSGLCPNIAILILSGHKKPDLVPSFINQWMVKPISLEVLDLQIRECQKVQ